MGTFWHNSIVAPIRRFLRDELNAGKLAYFPFSDRCPQCHVDNAILNLIGQDHYKCKFCTWHWPTGCGCKGELHPRHEEFSQQIKAEQARRHRF